MSDTRMVDLSVIVKQGGLVAAASGVLSLVAAELGASSAGQVLTILATGLMGIITMLVRHLLEKSGRADRRELRELREENRRQTAQIDQLSVKVVSLSRQIGNEARSSVQGDADGREAV